MSTTEKPRWMYWLIGVATVLLVTGYLTAEQWLGLIARLLGT